MVSFGSCYALNSRLHLFYREAGVQLKNFEAQEQIYFLFIQFRNINNIINEIKL